jgi:hypothetical protein
MYGGIDIIELPARLFESTQKHATKCVPTRSSIGMINRSQPHGLLALMNGVGKVIQRSRSLEARPQPDGQRRPTLHLDYGVRSG